MEPLMQALLFLSQAIGNEIVFCIILGAMVLLTEKRPQKRKKIVLAILITFLMVLLLKNIFAVERPCIAGGDGCPDLFFPDYSFPSGHAAMAFIVMIAFLDKPSFPFFWLFAFLVSFSRLLLGVHTFEDIAASLVLAPISYSLTDFVWRRYLE
ncbi:phosphatase PAP2 family protein [Candidatus Micrarchaeota archaeon]|nr:phosphatase PAP2 family protein [Candidatus Micrarchaeota archaeon]